MLLSGIEKLDIASKKTAIGDLTYDKKGDITRLDYVMYIWKKAADGKIAYIQE